MATTTSMSSCLGFQPFLIIALYNICGEGYAQVAASFSWWFGRSVGPMGMDETCLVLDRDVSALSLWIFGMLFADAGGLPTRGRSGGGADVEHSWSPHSPLRMF